MEKQGGKKSYFERKKHKNHKSNFAESKEIYIVKTSRFFLQKILKKNKIRLSSIVGIRKSRENYLSRVSTKE